MSKPSDFIPGLAFISCSTVLLHEPIELPRFLFPGGAHLSVCRIWPCHLQCLRLTSSIMLLIPEHLLASLLAAQHYRIKLVIIMHICDLKQRTRSLKLVSNAQVYSSMHNLCTKCKTSLFPYIKMQTCFWKEMCIHQKSKYCLLWVKRTDWMQSMSDGHQIYLSKQ